MSDDEGVTHTRDVVIDEHWRPGWTVPERDVRAIRETVDGITLGQTPSISDAEFERGGMYNPDDEDGIPFAFERERIELPPGPPPGPPRRLTGWARVKDTAHGVAIALAWLLFLAYLTWATMPQPYP